MAPITAMGLRPMTARDPGGAVDRGPRRPDGAVPVVTDSPRRPPGWIARRESCRPPGVSTAGTATPEPVRILHPRRASSPQRPGGPGRGGTPADRSLTVAATRIGRRGLLLAL